MTTLIFFIFLSNWIYKKKSWYKEFYYINFFYLYPKNFKNMLVSTFGTFIFVVDTQYQSFLRSFQFTTRMLMSSSSTACFCNTGLIVSQCIVQTNRIICCSKNVRKIIVIQFQYKMVFLIFHLTICKNFLVLKHILFL